MKGKQEMTTWGVEILRLRRMRHTGYDNNKRTISSGIVLRDWDGTLDGKVSRMIAGE